MTRPLFALLHRLRCAVVPVTALVTALATVLVAALVAALVAGCGGAPAPARHNVLLITVDTLRADFLGSYGFSLPATPNMDALARRGLLFETAVAASTATAPSHASIMTSRFVREHSVGSHNGSTRLEGGETLAERFRAAGYDTAAFVSNIVLKRRTGFDRGFDVYDDALPSAEHNREIIFERKSEQTVGRALAWLGARAPAAPFFLWVHLQDPHGPYTPPEPFASLTDSVPLRTRRQLPLLDENRGRGGLPRYQHVEGVLRADEYAARYAGEIAYTDHWVGELVAAIEQASEPDGAVVVLTADHGESLDENGFFFQHGHSTTHEQALVPLLVVAPGVEAQRISRAVHHVDIAPTLVELAGLAPLTEASGISLLEAAAGGGQEGEALRPLFSDIGGELAVYGETGYLRVRVGGEGATKIGNEGNDLTLQWAAYERGADGAWRKAPDPPRLPAAITEYLAAEVPVVPAHAMSNEDIERLRALGYLPPSEEMLESPGAKPGAR
ncbi:MAG: sulfatase [Deltaproteobacteria bacterium]|nr:sulfatase [Deltaproteobacteria bacterium]MBW2418702.1 sulfatase [Deltaproteobacteria bacterium]